ncbi:hypothetical protein [Candidatus Pelagibacter sp. HIMB1493]|uniref:hypothetical protein n=1 Tax=Candidatus Pelagibacter sp. HIMB1493 TaxID=3413334 RepID=UPI003F86A95F
MKIKNNIYSGSKVNIRSEREISEAEINKDPNILRRIKYYTETYDNVKLGKDFDKAIAAEDKNLAALGQIKPNILQRGKMIDGVKKRLANSRAYGYDPKKEKPFKKKTKIILPVIPTPTLDLEILKPFPKDPRLEALGKKIFEDKRRSDEEKNKGLAGILGVDIKKI